MEPTTFAIGCLAVVAAILGLVLALFALHQRGIARAVEQERRASAAELALAHHLRDAAAALAAHRLDLLHEAQRLIADASRGDQALADLAAELARVPDAGDPRERAERMLFARIAARQGRASGPGTPGPAAGPDGGTPGDGGGAAPLGG